MPMKLKKNNILINRMKSVGLFRLLTLGLSFFVIILTLVLTEFFNTDTYSLILSGYSPGSVAARDIVLPQDLVYLDSAATETERRDQEMRMMPVFVFDAGIIDDIKKKISGFHAYLARWKKAGGRGSDGSQGDDIYPELFQASEIDYIARVIPEDLLADKLIEYAEAILSEGYYSVPWNIPDTYPKGLIEVFPGRDFSLPSRIVDIDTVVTRKNMKAVFLQKASEDKLTGDQARALFIAAYAFFAENVYFDESATLARLKKIRDGIRPVFKTLPGGTLLVAKGDTITEADLEKIRLLAYSFQAKNSRDMTGPSTYLLLLMIIAVILLRPPMLEKHLKDKQFLFLMIINTVYLLASIMIYRFIALPENFPVAVILPTALVTMLISVLISYRAGILNTAILSLGQILFPAVSPEAIAFVFFSGIIGTRVVRKAEKRIDLLNAGMLLTLQQAGAAVILSVLAGYAGYLFFGVVLSAALSGLIWGILNLTILPLVENIMHAATKFRLMELSDLNTPTMKKMLSLAPGTYNHSISVGHLAETACREIGANALLARVGAYYHDIGKIDQAEYFIENQSGYNKHDYLRPGLSSTIIRSHVKIGVEQAAKLRLPDEVKDIIAQHHGAGLIRIFYQKALDNNDKCVALEDYAYEGSPPQSREAAVVMLADSVEAASRLFKKPTIVTIEKAVGAIFREKMSSGQLAEAPISLRDLTRTHQSFVKVLSGYFHSRIEYPAQDTVPR